MKWRKLGVVWKPDGSLWWARSHAACPTPHRDRDGSLRIYVQCRDEHDVGRVGYVILDPHDPLKVLRVSSQPVLDIGTPGTFDDNGVLQTSIVSSADGSLLLYYVGFELSHKIRYRLLTGVAISRDNGESFQRVRKTPILERSDGELFFRGGPFVLKEKTCFRMWYVAGSEWIDLEGKAMPTYDLRYMESHDGLSWPDQGHIVLKPGPDEHGFGRPFIVCENGFKRLLYSIRKKSIRQYRMGYAESPDGITWQRKDEEMGLEVSASGWDSVSVEYGAMVKADGKTWLFYNGNDFGGTGFGVAELERE